MSRFALHRQGQNSQVCPRWHAMACRGLTLVLPNSAGPGYRRAGLPTNPGVRLTVQTSVVRLSDPGLRCALEACTLGYCTCSFAGRAVAIGTNSSGVSPGYPAQAKGTDRVDEVADKLIVRPHVTLAGANDIEASFGDTQANAAIWQASYHDATMPRRQTLSTATRQTTVRPLLLERRLWRGVGALGRDLDLRLLCVADARPTARSHPRIAADLLQLPSGAVGEHRRNGRQRHHVCGRLDGERVCVRCRLCDDTEPRLGGSLPLDIRDCHRAEHPRGHRPACGLLTRALQKGRVSAAHVFGQP